jgi:hypothetical protein
MSSSYSGDPATSDKDTVRFLVGDTGPTNFDFSDEEIVFLLDTECNFWLASAVLCDKLTTIKSSGGLASKSVGGLSESYSQGSIQFYQNQAKLYRSRGSGVQVPRAACIPQIFSMGQFDSPGVKDPAVRSCALSWRSEEEVE